jgi:hypothetical protein
MVDIINLPQIQKKKNQNPRETIKSKHNKTYPQKTNPLQNYERTKTHLAHHITTVTPTCKTERIPNTPSHKTKLANTQIKEKRKETLYIQ